MSYSASQGFVPSGVCIGLKPNGGGSYTSIDEVKNIMLNGRKVDTPDTTNLLSQMKEFAGGIADPGTLEFEYNTIFSASQQAIETAVGVSLPYSWTLVVPLPPGVGGSTSGTPLYVTLVVLGVVTAHDPMPSIDRTKVLVGKATVKLSGAYTWNFAATTNPLTAPSL